MKVCVPTENGERCCRRIAITLYAQRYKKDEVRTMVDSCELVSEPRSMNDTKIYESIERKTENWALRDRLPFLFTVFEGWDIKVGSGQEKTDQKTCPSPL